MGHASVTRTTAETCFPTHAPSDHRDNRVLRLDYAPSVRVVRKATDRGAGPHHSSGFSTEVCSHSQRSARVPALPDGDGERGRLHRAEESASAVLRRPGHDFRGRQVAHNRKSTRGRSLWGLESEPSQVVPRFVRVARRRKETHPNGAWPVSMLVPA